MADYRVAYRYAKALLDLGIENNTEEKLFDDISSFKNALSNRDLLLLVKSPIIKADKKMNVFYKLFGEEYSKATLAFFDIITKKGRESALPEITESFLEQYKKLKQITSVRLTTATKITDEALEKIKNALLDSDVTERQVEIESQVNPKLIGGFVLEIGDKLYDASISHKLDEVKKQFLQNN